MIGFLVCPVEIIVREPLILREISGRFDSIDLKPFSLSCDCVYSRKSSKNRHRLLDTFRRTGSRETLCVDSSLDRSPNRPLHLCHSLTELSLLVNLKLPLHSAFPTRACDSPTATWTGD